MENKYRTKDPDARATRRKTGIWTKGGRNSECRAGFSGQGPPAGPGRPDISAMHRRGDHVQDIEYPGNHGRPRPSAGEILTVESKNYTYTLPPETGRPGPVSHHALVLISFLALESENLYSIIRHKAVNTAI
jgi:hypothetical protein